MQVRKKASLAYRCLRTLTTHSGWVIAALLVVVVGIWTFAELADEVTEGDTQQFDEWAVQVFRDADDPSDAIGPEWVANSALEITALGSNVVLGLVTLVACGYMWLQRKRRAMLLVLVSVVGGLVLSSLLKYFFSRERPDLVPHLTPIQTSSFPSGHSMLSAVVWLTLGTLLSRLEPRRRVKAYIFGVALFITILVGVSRVFLGVHYPTDVFAGWTAGLVWALVVLTAARWLQRRGAVEQTPEDAEDSAGVSAAA